MIRFGFCDILNNQGLSKYYQPQPSARLITLISTLIIPDITKASFNNYFEYHVTGLGFTCPSPPPHIFQVHHYNISATLPPLCMFNN